MRILLNGEPREVQAGTLAQLCAELGLDGPRVATALNGDFVARDARERAVLNEGDAVEIVAPMQGGQGRQGGRGRQDGQGRQDGTGR